MFEEQKKNGEITITDERMTRFWITLEQGINFVIGCLKIMKGGEIFVPKISSMKIIDLAKAVAPRAQKKIVGRRVGEKLHEILITEEETTHTREFKKYFVIEPEFPFWNEVNFRKGRRLPDGFRYRSDTNEEWISEDQMRKILKNLKMEE